MLLDITVSSAGLQGIIADPFYNQLPSNPSLPIVSYTIVVA